LKRLTLNVQRPIQNLSSAFDVSSGSTLELIKENASVNFPTEAFAFLFNLSICRRPALPLFHGIHQTQRDLFVSLFGRQSPRVQ
jgi:hypothetical protein